MTYLLRPGEDQAGLRRRMIRDGERHLARSQADAPGTPRRGALERADWSRANGLWHEARLQETLAEDLIPAHLRWAFYDEE